MNSDIYRERNLNYVIKYYLKKCKDSNIIIVEQNTNTEIKENERIKHIKINTNNLYNRGLGFNIGVNNTSKPYTLLIDNDCILDPKYLSVVIKNIYELKSLIPYNICVDLTQSESEYLIRTGIQTGGKSRGQKNSCVGGALFVSRDSFLKVGGYEEMYGWGCEDQIMFHKLKTLVDIARPVGNVPMFHLYHPSASTKNHLNSELYKKNLELMIKIEKMGKRELIDYLKDKSI